MLAVMFSKSPCCSAGCLLIYRSASLKHKARISLQVRHMLVPQLLHLNSSLTSGAVYTDAHSIVRYLKWGKGRQKQCLRNWFWVKGNLSKTSSIRHSLFLFGDPNIEPTQWVIYLQCVRSNLLLLSATFGRLTRRSQHRIKVLCPVFHPSIYKKKKEKKKKDRHWCSMVSPPEDNQVCWELENMTRGKAERTRPNQPSTKMKEGPYCCVQVWD